MVPVNAALPADLDNYLFRCADIIRDAVDADSRGWETNQQTVQTVERILLSVLLQEHDLGHLLTEDDALIDDIRRYLIQNHG